MNGKEAFKYTYSAAQQEEIKELRKKYLAPGQDKMEQLRQIDKRVSSRAVSWSISVGVTGVLIMGLGMSLVMVWQNYPVGIALGAVGLAVLAPANHVYNIILKKERAKAAPQVLQLIEEIEKGE